MKRAQVVDLARVRAALADLDRLAVEYPRLCSPDSQARLQQFVADGGLTAEDTEGENMAINPSVRVRMTPDIIRRADDLLPRISADPSKQWGRMSRSAVLRLALLEGLNALEKRYPKPAGSEAKP